MKTPQLRRFSLSSLFILTIIIVAGCKKTPAATVTTSAPTVSTADVILNVTSTSAQSGGVITATGSEVITANGVCYSATNKTPTTTDSKTSDPVSTSAAPFDFTSSLTGLTPNTVYYIRGYATNSTGTSYGSVLQFTTSSNLSSITATVSTFAGSGTAGYNDATGVNALFNNPQGVAVDANGNVFVADTYNGYIRKVTPSGVTTTIAGDGNIGYTDGNGATAEFYSPRGLAFDSQGNLYVADYGNNVIRKITPAGMVSTYAGSGTAGYLDGAVILHARFNGPSGIAFDTQGNMYIADRNNNAIRKISSAGLVNTLAGLSTLPSAKYANGTGPNAAFNSPTGVACDASGNVYVADLGNSAIRKITPAAVVTTVAGGPTQADLLNYPVAIAADTQGDFYIVDESGRILEYTSNSVLYTLAGSLNSIGFTDGVNTAAQFNNPQGITVDSNGNIYVADKNNNSIRKITVAIVP